tara:strand:- start:88 stop:357 length:270 start_codon:yes stop_codon:yes gene_type:complete
LHFAHFQKTVALAGIQTLAATGRGFAGTLPLAGIGTHTLAGVAAGLGGNGRNCKQRGGGHGKRYASGFFDSTHDLYPRSLRFNEDLLLR